MATYRSQAPQVTCRKEKGSPRWLADRPQGPRGRQLTGRPPAPSRPAVCRDVSWQGVRGLARLLHNGQAPAVRPQGWTDPTCIAP